MTTAPDLVVDLFAGPGGWDVAAHYLGIAPVIGIEWDAAACQTRAAAGLPTIRADVAQVTTVPYRGRVRGLIGSPPCTLFSSAGHGHGRTAIDLLAAGIGDLLTGRDTREQVIADVVDLIRPDVEAANARRKDPLDGPGVEAEIDRQARTAALVLEPARWIADLRPEWVTLEQVPAVLPLWETLAAHLRQLGYSTWAGALHAADYGVPQTRTRAVLVATRTGVAAPPAPTHAKEPGPAGLFGPALAPWVTMAEALGLPDADRVGFPRRDDTGTSPDGYRERDWFPATGPAPTLTEKTRSWVVNTGRDWKPGGTRDDAQQFDPTTQPAPTVDGKGRWHLDLVPGTTVELDVVRGSGMLDGERRNIPAAEPAPSITSRAGRWQWHLVPGGSGYRDANRRRYTPDEPAPTIAFGRDAAGWVWERPATTVAGDPRIQPPGHKMNAADPPGRYEGRAGTNAVRVSVAQAAALQSFPVGYPWQGTLTKQFQQVGNAVPPLLAAHILAAATGLDELAETG